MNRNRNRTGVARRRSVVGNSLEHLERRELLSATAGLESVVAPIVDAVVPPIVDLVDSTVDTAQTLVDSALTISGVNTPAGNYMLLPATGNIVIPTRTLNDPDIEGYILRDNWKSVNPAPGVYNWSRLDAAINKIVANGKDFKLTIFTGALAPDWLYQNGVQSMTFYENGGIRPTGTYKMPVPWDAKMLSYYDSLLTAMSAHFGSNSHLVGVNLGGPTQYSLEMHLPSEVTKQPGYSTAAIRGAWDHVLTTYAGLFPSTAGIVQLANPVAVTDGIAAQVAADAVSILGSRATLQHNALSAKSTLSTYNIHQIVSTYALQGVRTGFEQLTVSSNNRFGGSFGTAWNTLLRAGGKYLDLYQPDDKLARAFPITLGTQVDATVPEILARQAFYNNSAFDGYDPASSPLDDLSVATDKTALLPGQTAAFSNYTSYNRGLNGIMVDIAGLTRALTAADFDFRVGNDGDPEQWSSAPEPVSIDLRTGAGVDGSDRITVIWPDGAIVNQWLQVNLLVSESLPLLANDVFYFGNAIGEIGDSQSHAVVNAVDEIRARDNPQTFLDPALVDSLFDINRDRYVNAIDQILIRSNATSLATALVLLKAPTSGQSSTSAALTGADALEAEVAQAPLADEAKAAPTSTDGQTADSQQLTTAVQAINSAAGKAGLHGLRARC